ncbi:unnamed protein product [Cylindrotheca closterium]|uniref:G-protein coupled receptors family 1 profile domain-containing protein n=1 Tax=Cylindrotheca closterium TaxID=2856 RepID=A0AAD2FQS1_9STRA|nr:unnamed protein product [Cylindrotheca closterium]
MCENCDALDAQNSFSSLSSSSSSSSSSSPRTILAHPAMFGVPWTSTVTAVVMKTTIDLCNDTLDSTDSNIFSNWSTNELNNNQYQTAIFYDDPAAAEWIGSCDHSKMAQTVEKLYPFAKYLLISKDTLTAFQKFDEEPDTNLSLASVMLEDAKEINSMFQNETDALIVDGLILLTIDVSSRAYIDTCNCRQDVTDVERKRTWAILFRVSSSLSILGSTYILLSLVGTSARRKKNMPLLFNRLLFSICCFDILSSVALFCGRWAAPSSPPGDFEKYYSQERWDIDYPDASGSIATCTLQGIMIQLGVCGSTVFTAFLAIQSLLVVKYSWNEKQMKKVEIFFFAFGISFAVLTATIAAAMEMTNALNIGFCWIDISPAPCDLERLGPLFDEYCDENVRGSDPLLYQIGLAMGWAFLTLLIIIYAMASLFFYVRHQENRATRWTLTAQTGRQQKLVLARSMMYIFVYLIVWLPSSIAIVFDTVAAATVVTIALPSQGALNAIIYSGVVERYCIPRQTARQAAITSTVQFSQATASGDLSTEEQDRSNRWSFR